MRTTLPKSKILGSWRQVAESWAAATLTSGGLVLAGQGQGIDEGPNPPPPQSLPASASRYVLEHVDSRALPRRLAGEGIRVRQ